ncbi:MAG TPA: hypothetical protein VFU82_03680 [Gammaproteobacteria bacterium]|nr:hypothetical protein [Gammaproteobacteria bacterium]
MGIYNLAVRKLNKLNDIRLRRMGRWKGSNTVKVNHSAIAHDVLETSLVQLVPTKKSTQVIGKNWLANYFDNQASEHGEDGIISKIFEILKPKNKWLCEFGAHDPEIISNSWRLINKEGWSGVLIEGDDKLYEKLQNYYKKTKTVTCLHKMVNYEGEDRLDLILASTAIPKNPDLMIIDIDGNDYHVWDALVNYDPEVIMIEFNAAIPLDIHFVQEKIFFLNQGSSLRAIVSLANKKGYKLIAATAWNAFFVKNENYNLFFSSDVSLEEMYVYPAKHPIEMRAFQTYDGTIVISYWNEMMWHSVNLKQNDYQVLPASYRVFRRELAVQDFEYEKAGKRYSGEDESKKHLTKINEKPSNRISAFARNEYSRYGEDGIIEQLVKVISTHNRYFVDVGAWDGVTHSKSRNLAINHGWRGLLVEESVDAYAKLRTGYRSISAIATLNSPLALEGEHSLNAMLRAQNAPNDPDFMTISVYGMDYYLWESLTEYTPKIVAIQFNPTIHNELKFIQANDFEINHGCSLRALLELGNYKGYELVGVTLDTAFFLDRKYAYRFFELVQATKGDLDEMYEPYLMRLYQLYDGTLNLEGLDRLFWHNMPIDLEKIQVIPKHLRQFHQHADGKNKKFFYRV